MTTKKLKTYDVTIVATVRKTYTVQAENEDDASTEAHEQFTLTNDDDIPEKYEQYTKHIEEVK